MFLWWRVFYGVMNSRWFVWLLRGAVGAADRIKPGAALTTLELRIGESWPLRVPGWVNIHVSELLWSVRRRHVVQPRRRAPTTAPRRRRRLGCFGPFSGLLGFPTTLFSAFPSDTDLYIYDLRYKGQLAPALMTLAAGYRAVELETADDYRGEARRAADAINRDDLDCLLVIRSKRDAYDVLDHVRTPCIAHVCTGSDILHHPQVDFDFFCQPEAGFFPRGRELFCEFTRQPVKDRAVYPASLCFDRRDLDVDSPVPSWHERSALIVFHGSLYKMASTPFLDCIFQVMADNEAVDFVFMGKDWDGALSRIRARARQAGLSGRVHYEGVFSAMRDADGRVNDPGWLRLLELLKRARLAPDPWPVGGASARFEAYVMGAPTVHMGLRTDPESWGRPHPSVCEVPNLLVPQATAYSVATYQELAHACLTEPSFADDVASTQRAIARAASDPGAYWLQVFRALDEWQSPRGNVVAEAQ